ATQEQLPRRAVYSRSASQEAVLWARLNVYLKNRSNYSCDDDEEQNIRKFMIYPKMVFFPLLT
uniref:hypothetical protein n=1 Tax=Endozoicomonas sp. ALC013 TaxID=3403076 RepID=UPI003BB77966